ncbi:MAG TPA: alpha/beta hydrolase [Polyangiaceae bacterium]
MDTSLISAGEHTLAVRRSGNSGPPILFVHGNSCSGRCFDKQLESPLADRYRLFAIDLPGHGGSSRAAHPDETYNLPGYAAAISAAAAALEVPDAVVVGWSLGAYAVVEAIELLPLARGFLVFGGPPIASNADLPRVLSSAPEVGAAFREDSTDEEVFALLRRFFRPGFGVPGQFFDDFRRADKRARAALAASVARNQVSNGVRTVGEMQRPLAILHGADEAIALREGLDSLSMPTLWRGRIQDVADAGHAVQWERPEVFNALLGDFALDCGARPA